MMSFTRSTMTPRSPVSNRNTQAPNHLESQPVPVTDTVEMVTIKKLSELKALLNQTNKRLALLEAENEELRKKVREYSSEKVQDQPDNYQTDEDILEAETNWTTIKNKKSRPAKRQKRKAGSSPEVSSIPTRKENSTVKPTLTVKASKELPPPPINIIGIDEHAKIKDILNSSNAGVCKLVALKDDVWKINTSSPENYRNLVSYLNTKNIEWYTYEDKNNRPTKVMARGLHPSCDPMEIIEDIKERGLLITNATNIKKKETSVNADGIRTTIQRGLPLFMLSFQKEEDIHKIFTISSILNMKVKIEALRKTTNQIPQCKKCQGFNHTEKYCHKTTKCVKCAESHLTKECKVERETPAKCTNCNGQHPASYRGCEVAVQLQKQRNNAIKAKQNPKPKTSELPKPKNPENQRNTAVPTLNGTETYSQVLKLVSPVKENQKQLKEDQTKTQNTLDTILQKLESITEKIENHSQSISMCNKNISSIFEGFSYIKGYLEQKKSWKEYTKPSQK